MKYSRIHVQYHDGSKPHGAEVVLGFTMGMTTPAYTDRYGDAVVEHESVGRAEVYVNGENTGSFHAPGETVATIRS